MGRKKPAIGVSAPTFEESLARLEDIVSELEKADLPLERSLEVFEEGVRLSRLLHERLSEAERRVDVLTTNKDGERVAEPFVVDGAPAGGRSARGGRASAGVVANDAEDADDTEDAEEDDADSDGDDDATGGHGQKTLF